MDLGCQTSHSPFLEAAMPAQSRRADRTREAERHAFDLSTASYAVRCSAAWTQAQHAANGFGAAVSVAEKQEREHRADQDSEAIEAILRRWPRSPAKREAWRQALLEVMRRLAHEHMACDAEALDQLLNAEGVEATRQFLRDARTFAPAISDKDLFQALRNVWVIHSVQLLLHSPIALSPAVFGYSMLYPWTDNRLDDPQLGHAAKVAFGEWLTRRLAGEQASPPDTHCEEVSALVGRIEQVYPRAEFPDVYFSLQAIHAAQMKSLNQQDSARSWDERALLDLSIAKGGASVVADACMVRGWLTTEEAEFMFAYGVVLQLMDDLQDFRDDLAHGHMTIFTRQAKLGALDGLTSQLWAFTQTVLGSYSRRPEAGANAAQHGGCPPFKVDGAPDTQQGGHQTGSPGQHGSLVGLVQENLRMLLMQSVVRSREFYTAAFVSGLEEASPVRFVYLAGQEKTLAGRYSKVLASIRRNRKLDSVFEMLG
jgi:hypothetical protein